MPHGTPINSTILEAALIGLQHQRDQIETRIVEISRLLGTRAARTISTQPRAAEAPAKRTLSPAARQRIAAAQRKRWAEFKKRKEAPAKKRRLSAAGRKRIAEATKKRWADYRRKQVPVQQPAAKASTEKEVAGKKPVVKKGKSRE